MSRPIPEPTRITPATGQAFDVPPDGHRTRLDTLSALRALAAGHRVPNNKYQVLIRTGYVKVRGQSGKKKPVLTGRGWDAIRHECAATQ